MSCYFLYRRTFKHLVPRAEPVDSTLAQEVEELGQVRQIEYIQVFISETVLAMLLLQNSHMGFHFLSPALAQFYVYQLLQALCALHAGGVVHGDVRPSRCVVSTDMTLKVAPPQ
jgi:serine/threonine protein kinase